MNIFNAECEACTKSRLFIFRSLMVAFLFFIMISLFNPALPAVASAEDGGLLPDDIVPQDQGTMKDQGVMENEVPSKDEGAVQDQGPSKDEGGVQDRDDTQDQGGAQRDGGEAPSELIPE